MAVSVNNQPVLSATFPTEVAISSVFVFCTAVVNVPSGRSQFQRKMSGGQSSSVAAVSKHVVSQASVEEANLSSNILYLVQRSK